MKPLSLSQSLKAKAIEEIADKIADLQDEITNLRNQRDDLIRDLVHSEVSQSRVARIADISREQVRNILSYRYSRETRRRKVRNPGPERD